MYVCRLGFRSSLERQLRHYDLTGPTEDAENYGQAPRWEDEDDAPAAALGEFDFLHRLRVRRLSEHFRVLAMCFEAVRASAAGTGADISSLTARVAEMRMKVAYALLGDAIDPAIESDMLRLLDDIRTFA